MKLWWRVYIILHYFLFSKYHWRKITFLNCLLSISLLRQLTKTAFLNLFIIITIERRLCRLLFFSLITTPHDFLFLWENIHDIKFTSLAIFKCLRFLKKWCSWVALSTFTMVCNHNHHHYPFPELFHLPQLKRCTSEQSLSIPQQRIFSSLPLWSSLI